MFGFWKKIGRQKRSGLSGTLIGHYDFRGDRLAGRVRSEVWAPVTDAEVCVRRHGEILVSCTVTPDQNPGVGAFAIPVGDRFSLRELLNETVVVTAHTARGDTGVLRPDGAAQLELIREYLGRPCARLFDIDFTNGGNADTYLGVGWSAPEADFRWTNGGESVIRFDAAAQPATYGLRITCGAFIHPPEITRQRMEIYLNDTRVGDIAMTAPHMHYHETEIPSAAFGGESSAMLRFVFPDAEQPCAVGPNQDARRLAFTFRRVTLVRFLS